MFRFSAFGPHLRWLTLAMIVCATVFLASCDQNTTAPTPVGSIVFGQPMPAAGSTNATAGAPPGAFIPRGSDRLSIPIFN